MGKFQTLTNLCQLHIQKHFSSRLVFCAALPDESLIDEGACSAADMKTVLYYKPIQEIAYRKSIFKDRHIKEFNEAVPAISFQPLQAQRFPPSSQHHRDALTQPATETPFWGSTPSTPNH